MAGFCFGIKGLKAYCLTLTQQGRVKSRKRGHRAVFKKKKEINEESSLCCYLEALPSSWVFLWKGTWSGGGRCEVYQLVWYGDRLLKDRHQEKEPCGFADKQLDSRVGKLKTSPVC